MEPMERMTCARGGARAGLNLVIVAAQAGKQATPAALVVPASSTSVPVPIGEGLPQKEF